MEVDRRNESFEKLEGQNSRHLQMPLQVMNVNTECMNEAFTGRTISALPGANGNKQPSMRETQNNIDAK